MNEPIHRFTHTPARALVLAALLAGAVSARAGDPASDQWAASLGPAQIIEKLSDVESLSDLDEAKAKLGGALLASWSRRDLAGTLDWFSKRNGADLLQQLAREELAETLVRKSSVAEAITDLEKIVPSSSRREIFLPVIQRLTARDPAGTAAALDEILLASSDNPDALWLDLAGQVAAQWANRDPRAAIAWAQSLPEGAARARALSQVGCQWAALEPEAAARFAAVEDNSELLANVTSKWAEKDAPAAAAWLGQLPGTNSHALLRLAAFWSQTDPSAAARWVKEMPENPLRSEAMQLLLRSWTASDSGAASQWWENLPASPSRDAAAAIVQVESGDNEP